MAAQACCHCKATVEWSRYHLLCDNCWDRFDNHVRNEWEGLCDKAMRNTAMWHEDSIRKPGEEPNEWKMGRKVFCDVYDAWKGILEALRVATSAPKQHPPRNQNRDHSHGLHAR